MQFDAFQSYADDLVKQCPVPGLALAFSDNGAMRYEYTHGCSHIEHLLPATIASRFGVGSITKSFTAIALLQLQERGKLTVNDAVTRYLPSLRFPGAAQVTLHHLMTHSAGLPMLGTEMHADIADGAPPMPPLGPNGRTRIHNVDELIELIAELTFTPVAPPGKVMSYSNDGWALLGAVIERVSDTPYIDYITKQIIEPLQLTETMFGTFNQSGNGTSRYAATPDGRFDATGGTIWRPAMLSAGGGPMLSTCQDLLRYADFFRSNGQGILTETSLRQMTTPYLPVTATSAYGYGINIEQVEGVGTMIGHGGGDLGVSAYFGTVPATGQSVAVMSNAGTGLPHAFTHAVLRVATGLTPDPGTPQPIACEQDTLARITGTFESALVKSHHRFYLEGDELLLESGGQTHKPIYIGNNTFIVPGNPNTTRSFVIATDANGTQYGLRTGGRVFTPAAQ